MCARVFWRHRVARSGVSQKNAVSELDRIGKPCSADVALTACGRGAGTDGSSGFGRIHQSFRRDILWNLGFDDVEMRGGSGARNSRVKS